MIRFADGEAVCGDLVSLLDGEDFLHGCILSAAYRARDAATDARFWVCYDRDERPRAAVLGQPGCFLLCDGGLRETEELARFLRFSGCTCLVGRLALLEALHSAAGFPRPYGAPAMVWQGGDCVPDAGIRRVREFFRPVYQLILQNYDHFDNYGSGGGYNEWLSGLRLRERDGVSGLYALYEGEDPVAAAAIAGASGRCADIGGLVVRRDRRGTGLGKRLIRHLTALVQHSGRTPVLGCARPAAERLERYYESAGFQRYDDWAAAHEDCRRQPGR